MSEDPTLAAARLRDLDRRVSEISRYPAGTFGEIGYRELLVAALGCVVLPLIVVWWLR